MTSNREVVLAEYVGKGNLPEPRHFKIQDSNDRNLPLNEGEIRLKTLFLSVDPYMRGRMNNVQSYVSPFQLEKPLSGSGAGEVIETKNDQYKVGDVLTSQKDLSWPWREYTIFNNDRAALFTKIPSTFPPDLISHTIGQLGMPGLTSYFGMLERGLPKPGETLVVSGGAGACGAIAGQIGKIKGLRVIGIAGSAEKVAFMKDLGFDEGVNYTGKSQDQLYDELKGLCPNGVDIYYDNVGGEISNAVLRLMNQGGRVPICGQISQYNKETMDALPTQLEEELKTKNVDRRWFMVFSFKEKFDSAWNELYSWVQENKIKLHQTLFEGIEKMPEAFLALFKGDNIGKLTVKVAQ
jgi:NADPH-dependent curcumin reductase CurA